jgi:hypothetical protein
MRLAATALEGYRCRGSRSDPKFVATHVAGRGYEMAALGPREFARYIADH